jgi:tetratricopeptide (TPR) repeat protein
MQMYYVSRIFAVLALAALGLAMWFSVVLARADAYFRKGDVTRAIEIAPRNTEYLTLRALQLDYDARDSSAVTMRIAALNPLASAPRIKLGLAAELAGDPASAEKWLLEAARVDRQFEPKWTLANFYFRSANTAGFWDGFWEWMRAALAVSYGDRSPAFDLCWRVSSDAAEILRAMPDRHDVLAAYVVYLAQTNRTAALTSAARRLSAFPAKSDRALFLGACDQLIAARDPGALALWQLAGEPAPRGMFNGHFDTPPINHGFDWRFDETPGVTHIDRLQAHRIVLNGRQPETAVLLAQTLNLASGRYKLQWDASDLSGLEWRIAGAHAPITAGGLSFTAPPGGFVELQLVYQRPLGEPRAEGTVELRNILLTEDRP